jgi:hypothetical protein
MGCGDPKMKMTIYILTEDSGKDSFETLKALILQMLRCHEKDHRGSEICFETLHAPIVQANGWKNLKKQQQVTDLARALATKVLEPNAFICFHFDADCAWSSVYQPSGQLDLSASENWTKFEEIIISRVMTTLTTAKGARISAAQASYCIQEKLFRLIPFYSIESWLFQNIDCAEQISLEQYDAANADEFAEWRQDRAQLDEHHQPKDTICLKAKHNLALVTTAYPAQKVYEARRSFWWSVKQMEGSWALRCALDRTRRP